MKSLFSLTFALLLLGLACSDRQANTAAPPPPSAAAGKHGTAGDLAGHWTGNAQVIVQWARQKELPVDLVIGADGRVSGTVGDAKLVDGRLRTQAVGSPFRVHGKLEGKLIDAEGIHRDAVDVLFDRAGDGSLKGGVHTSGSEFGGKKSMKLSAANMVLRRRGDSDQAAGAATSPSARLGQ